MTADEEIKEKALNIGVSDGIAKPIDFKALLKSIKETLPKNI